MARDNSRHCNPSQKGSGPRPRAKTKNLTDASAAVIQPAPITKEDHPVATSTPLILASGSPWRRQLLDRLRLPYEAVSPDIDESARVGESPADLVQRLAVEKAAAVSARRPEAVVIGSDQVAELDGDIIGKPGGRDAAVAQLRRQSGRRVVFHTGVAVCRPGHAEALRDRVEVVTTFRELSDAEIARYVAAEDVTATAGSIKSEGLGITLVESIHSDDPTALVGLPLIALRRMLTTAGYVLP